MNTLENLFPDVTFTDSQKELCRKLVDFLNDESNDVFILCGYAGTGKTFLTLVITNYLEQHGRNIRLCAPTGKAARVLSEKSGKPASTIHREIFANPRLNDLSSQEDMFDDGYQIRFPLSNNLNPDGTVYIVDESSMIGDSADLDGELVFGSGKLLSDFVEYVKFDKNSHKTKVIIIGDNAQLLPVRMVISPALDEGYLKENFGLRTIKGYLTEIVRQKENNQIIKEASKIREAIACKKFNILNFSEKIGEVEKIDPEQAIEEVCREVIKQAWHGGSIPCVLLARTNREVLYYNEKIRLNLFKGDVPPREGEPLLVCQNNRLTGLMNGELVRIEEIIGNPWTRNIPLKVKDPETGQTKEKKVTLAYQRMLLSSTEDVEVECIVCTNLLGSEDSCLSKIERRASYVGFRMRNESLHPRDPQFKSKLLSDEEFNALQVRYGYAMTGHKAQGSQWDTVYVDCGTEQNQRCDSYFRWLYTAITRASEVLKLINAPEVSPYSSISFRHSSGEIFSKSEDSDSSQPHANLDEESKKAMREFAIPENPPLLSGIFCEVRKILPQDTTIKNVLHFNYKETYIFEIKGKTVKVDFNYNGKQKVTKVRMQVVCEEASILVDKLSSLEGYSVAHRRNPLEEKKEFSKPFLADFDTKIRKKANLLGVGVRFLGEHNYSLRYSFSFGREEPTTLDFYYNEKETFTKIRQVYKNGQVGEKIKELITSLRNG